jgi:hypothetical protein
VRSRGWTISSAGLKKKIDIVIDTIDDNEKPHILMPFMSMNFNYEHNMVVIDELVYYLVKAVCSMIISTVANFFEQIHSLHDIKLMFIDRSFTFLQTFIEDLQEML